MVKDLGINKSTINLKVNIYKLIKKSKKLKNLTTSAFYFKNYLE